jgi:CheY-like chemotaxis protein
MAGRPILIVEDSPEDYEITVRALRKSKLNNPIYHCDNGDDAMDFIYQRNRFSDKTLAPRPGIILLDLNIPGTGGKEILKELKSDPQMKSIPVVVLTTSNDTRDINRCYEYGANSYLQKPVDLIRFFESIERMKEYWFEIAILPSEETK